MNIGSVSSSSTPEIRETTANNQDVKNDHDRDDAAGASPAPLSTVNGSGQQIGTLINRSA
jgi:hypothetical protein